MNLYARRRPQTLERSDERRNDSERQNDAHVHLRDVRKEELPTRYQEAMGLTEDELKAISGDYPETSPY